MGYIGLYSDGCSQRAEVNSQDGGIPDRINAYFSVTMGSLLVGSHRILLDLKKDSLRHVYFSKTRYP